MPYYNDPIPYPGIHRFKLPLTGSPLKYVNAYLLPSSSGHLLIDTCWNTEESHTALAQQLQAVGIQLEEIKHIVITHAHVDHYGLAARVLRRCNATLSMHELEEKMIKLRYQNTKAFAIESNALLRTSGVEEQYVPEPQEMVDRFDRLVLYTAPNTLYKGGETLAHGGFEFQIIWTPGHSPGHICLYDPKHRIFFSGDHVLPGITSHIGINPKAGPNPLDDYLHSLKRLLTLDVELILPAHGPPIKGFERRLKQIMTHHQDRKSEILKLLGEQDGPANAFELVTAMKWYSKGRPSAWQTLRDFDQRLAIAEVMAHLASLVNDGDLTQNSHNGVVYYQPAGR